LASNLNEAVVLTTTTLLLELNKVMSGSFLGGSGSGPVGDLQAAARVRATPSTQKVERDILPSYWAEYGWVEKLKVMKLSMYYKGIKSPFSHYITINKNTSQELWKEWITKMSRLNLDIAEWK